jgi:hypothetical protein
MDPFEPQVRRRGLFTSPVEFEDGEAGEMEMPEGIRIRIRIVPPRPRRAVAAAGGLRTVSASPFTHASRPHPGQARRASARPELALKSASATGTRRPQ